MCTTMICIIKSNYFQWLRMKKSGNNNSKPVKLGITGGVGSGKSMVCEYLKNKGLYVVSTDELARKAVMPGTTAYDQIVSCFGEDVLSDDGTLNRKKLRGIITADKKKKEMLEQFVHPEVFVQMEKEFNASEKRRDPVIAVEVPLLFETGLENFFDFVLTVSVNADVRAKRLMSRDQITKEEAEAFMGLQMPEADKIKKSDFVIDNNGSMEETRVTVELFYENLMDLVSRQFRVDETLIKKDKK